MVIHYRPSRADVGRALVHNARTQPRLQLILAGLVLLPVAVQWFEAHRAGSAFTSHDAMRRLAVGVALLVILPLYVMLRTKRDVRMLEITPNEIRTTVGRLSGVIPWRAVQSIADTGTHVFITRTNQNLFSIPGGAFASADDRAEFLRLAHDFHRAARAGAEAA